MSKPDFIAWSALDIGSRSILIFRSAESPVYMPLFLIYYGLKCEFNKYCEISQELPMKDPLKQNTIIIDDIDTL